MKKDVYVYPAIFTIDDDGVSIEFPDLPGCIPCASDLDEAVNNSKEALALHLFGMEEDNLEIPDPTSIKDIKLDKNQTLMLVEVYMPLYRDAIENEYIRKNCTIPQWLNKLAEEKKMNFSQVLQLALKERLGIKDKHI